jgi:hypothetical protein
MSDAEDIRSDLNQAKNALLEAIQRGFSFEDWINGPVGKYLVLRAEAERLDRLEQLATIDANDAKAIAKVQQRIAVLDSWQEWVADAITEGRQAQHEFVDLGG